MSCNLEHQVDSLRFCLPRPGFPWHRHGGRAPKPTAAFPIENSPKATIVLPFLVNSPIAR